MPELTKIRDVVNAERSAVASASLLVDWIAISIQSLVDRKSRLEDFQEFAAILHTNRQALAQAVARNTSAESSGAAEAVPAEAAVTDAVEAPPEDDEKSAKKAERRETVKSATKAVGTGYIMGRTAGAAKSRKQK